MKFDLDDLNPAVWFDLPDDDDGGRVQVRTCAGGDLEQIIKETTKKRVEYKRGQRYEYIESDDEKHQRLLWDFCIVDWENIYDAKGKKIPCTIENKLLLMKHSIPFATFVGECLEKLNTDTLAMKTVAEKNSSTSQPE